MTAAIPTTDERHRLEVLKDYGVLDTDADSALDDLVALVARICDAPMAMISLVDADRIWFAAKTGTDVTERPRDITFCGHALQGRDLFTVTDAREDERFFDNPLVLCEEGIVFYAGAPLVSPEGAALGALCVIDRVPRQLEPWQENAIKVLARQVMTHLELRRSIRKFQISQQQFKIVTENARTAITILDRDRRYVYQNDAHAEIMGVPPQSLVGKRLMDVMPEIYEWQIRSRMDAAFDGERMHYELVKPSADGEVHHEVTLEPTMVDGEVAYVTAVITDVTESNRADSAARRLAAIVEFSDDAIIGKDLNGVVTSWNHGAEKIFGYKAEEMVGTSITRLIPDDRWDEETEILARIRLGQSLEHFETVRRRKDGRLINVSVTASPIKDDNGNVVGVSKVARDTTDRKLAEQELRMLNACVANLNDIVLVTEADCIDEPGPKIVFANEAFQRVTGYKPAEVIGRNPRFLQGEKTDLRVLQEIREALRREEPIRREILNYGKDGREYWLDIDIAPIFDATGKCTHFAAIERDVTERKRVEEQLLSKTALLEAQVNSALDGILIVDTEKRVILQNQRFMDLWRFPDALLSAHVGTRLDWIQQQVRNPREYMAKIEYLFANRDSISRDDVELLDGRNFERDSAPVLGADGKYYGRIWVFRDVTERKRALEQIAEQAALLDKARDAIVVRDLDGQVIYWNNGAELIYGWTREEVVGRNIGDLFFDEPQRMTDVNKALMEHGEWSGEVKHRTRHRGEITVEARWTLIRDEQGLPGSVLAINTDVTEKKKIEAQFMRAQRMESIGTLAGGVAHDLNNILSPIMMAVEVLRDLSRDPMAKEILDTLAISAARGADIVRQVLSFARGMDGRRVEVQAAHLLKDIASIIRDTFPKNIRLEFSADSDMWTVVGDPTQLHQILLNLCVNARDAMPNGGGLTVTAGNCEVDPQYAAMDEQAKAGPYVLISVSDTGTGIPREIIDKIFEPFFTTKDVTKGTGLGLSTVMAIVKSHGGFINVASEPGMGTAFNVYLPTAQETPSSVDEAPEAALQRGNGEIILVVDDEASIRSITRGTLEAYGYQVLTAADGVDAVAQFATHRDKIAVVLVDMMMPVMDGPATIHALLRMDPGVRIIASSGVSDGPGLTRACDAGVTRILAKPYTAASLLDTVAALLREA